MWWHQARELARRQHGLVAGWQLAERGVSYAAVRSAVERGHLVRVRQDVFRVDGVPDARLASLLGAVLAMRGRAVVTRRTAAVDLWGVPDLARPQSVELLTTLTQGLALPSVRFSRTDHLPRGDRTVRHGVPTITYARLVIELAPRLSVAELGAVADFGLRRRLLTIPALAASFERWDGPGRRGGRRVAAVLGQRAAGYRIPDSRWEDEFYRRLLAAGLPPGERWYRVAERGVGPYVLDLAYPDHRVGVEFQSYEWHGQRTDFDADAARAAALASIGWMVVPVTSRSGTRVTVDRVRRTLEHRSPAVLAARFGG